MAAPRGRGGGRGAMMFVFFLSAQLSVMSMVIIPLLHYDNLWRKQNWSLKKMCRSLFFFSAGAAFQGRRSNGEAFCPRVLKARLTLCDFLWCDVASLQEIARYRSVWEVLRCDSRRFFNYRKQSPRIAGFWTCSKMLLQSKRWYAIIWLFCDGFSVDRGRGGDSPLNVAGYQPASLSQSRDERHDDDRNMSEDWM